RYLLHEAAAAAFRLVAEANSFVEVQAPWKLAREADRGDELDRTLAALIRALATAAVLLFPFMPGKMTRLWEQLGSGEEMPIIAALDGIDASGWRVTASEVLFPRPDL